MLNNKTTAAGGVLIGLDKQDTTLVSIRASITDPRVVGSDEEDTTGSLVVYVSGDETALLQKTGAGDLAWSTVSAAGGDGAQNTVTAGALNPHASTNFLSVTGAQEYSLADGVTIGQRTRIEVTVAAAIPVGTLTIADAFASEPTTWVFNAVGQMIELEWTATGWKLLDLRSAGTDTPAAASTLNQLVMNHLINISGTNDWVLGVGQVPGQVQHFKVGTAAAIPVGTISGLFYDEDGSADGVDINLDAAADMAAVRWNGLRWDPFQLVAATVS